MPIKKLSLSWTQPPVRTPWHRPENSWLLPTWTGIILTKMDGTAKGGIAVAIQAELGIPVKYIGIGEKIEDLQKFDADAYVEAIFNE